MRQVRSSALYEYRLEARFDTLREKLSTPNYAARRTRPLAFWAHPSDRRLPLAFMGRKIDELLKTPFDQLLATPGVGQKKISTLLTLLDRVASEEGESADEPAASLAAQVPVDREASTRGFDPASISESLWAQWRAAVVRHRLDSIPLGRLAPSLERLPRVLWNTPLGAYTHLTLDEIRHLKTHGTKRVAAVLEVFAAIHRVLGSVAGDGTLDVRIAPRFVPRVEGWLSAQLERTDPTTAEEVDEHFIAPLLEQVRIDAGPQIALLAERRLHGRGSQGSVRIAAREFGLTRARIYQLLADAGAVLHVRWPEGHHLVWLAWEKLQSEQAAPAVAQFHAAAELFFPARAGVTAQPQESSDEAEDSTTDATSQSAASEPHTDRCRTDNTHAGDGQPGGTHVGGGHADTGHADAGGSPGSNGHHRRAG